ncbi:MAG: LacI family DNA-binding transcriptional regulator [Planctomycetota bacterium]
MPITQRQLAKHLNLHQATVSRCFMSPQQVKPETLDRVLRVANELGYRRNSAASAMRKQRIGAVGLLLGMSGGENFLPLGLLKNFEWQARKHDQRLMIAHVADDRLGDPAYVPGILREMAVDALIVDYITDSADRLAELIEHYHVPSIWVNSKRPMQSVYVDDAELGARVATRFVEAGHRRIATAVFGCRSRLGNRPHYSAWDRGVGFAEAASAAGAACTSWYRQSPIDDPEEIALTTQWLRGDDRPTAVLANSEKDANAIAFAAAAAGLTLGKDLELLAVGTAPVTVPGRSLDTYVVPQEELATAVFAELDALLREPKTARTSIPVRFDDAVNQRPPTAR